MKQENPKRPHGCALLVLLIVGCTTVPEANRMVVSSLILEQSHRGSVQLTVNKNADVRENSSFGEPVSMAALEQALRESIESCGLFEAVVGSDYDYLLEVTIFDLGFDLDRPKNAGADYQISAEWKLTKRGSPAPIFHEALTGWYSQSMSEALNGITRATRTREGAVRELIREGMVELSRVVPPQAPDGT